MTPQPRQLFRIKYQTKIVDVLEVNLAGKLEFDTGDFGDWIITETHSGGVIRPLDEWLKKFEGRRVRILIEALDTNDDTRLMEGYPRGESDT